MSTLFISHSSHDNAAAKELQARLEEQGHHSVFLDLDPETGIQAGVSWERTLYTKLRACRAVVALCSDSYLASQWCFAEIALARMEGKELFVLQIDPWSENTNMPSILTEEQFIDLRTNQDDGYQRLWNGFKVKGIVAAEAREWKLEEPPYPGLRAFREEDAPIFFGRDEEIRAGSELLNRVRRQGHPRLVMVLGSSGSGKSSLVRAGIVPQLRRDRGQWLVVKPFRPGWQPVRELAASLSQAFEEAGQPFAWEEIHRWLEPAADGDLAAPAAVLSATAEAEPSPAAARERLLQALSAMEGELTAADDQVTSSVRRLKDYLGQQQTETPLPSGGAPPPSVASPLAELASRLRLQSGFAEASVVLVIDQFEELLGHDARHPASRFLAMLRVAMEVEDSPLLVIGTMRSDYLGVLQRSAPLQGFGFKSLSVGPMSRDGMRQIIEEPAKLGQLQLEKGLSDLLLEDTETSDALPLLAFTLRMMWDRYRDKQLLEIREYRDFGRLQGAIAQVADETFEAVLEQVQDQDARDALARELRDAFLSMARPAAEGSGWSRQPVSWDQLSEKVQPALAPFIDPQRLLVKREDGTVEVAHEALFRSWHRLKSWLDENAEGLHLLREIQVEAKKWDKADSDEKREYLWSGGRMARAVELRDSGVLALEDLDRSFLEASARAEEARQRRKRRVAWLITGVSAAAAIVMLVFGLAAEKQARIATSRLLAAQSLTSFSEAADLSMLLSVEAFRTHDTFEARSSMLSILNRVSRLEAFLIPPRPLGSEARLLRVGGIVFYGGGEAVVVSNKDRGLVLIDPSTGVPVEPNLGTDGRRITSVAFSPRSGRLAWADESGTVTIYGSRSPAEKAEKIPVVDEGDSIHDIAVDPTGQLLAVALGDGSVRVWNVDTRVGSPLAPHTGKWGGAAQAVAFSPDGSILAAGSYAAHGNEGTVRLWKMPEGRTVGQPLVSRPEGSDLTGDGGVNDVAFSPDGGLLAWSVGDGVVLWDLEKAELHDVLKVDSSDKLTGLAFSGAGSPVLAAGSKSGAIWRWDVESLKSFGKPLRGHSRGVDGLAFSPDGKALLSLNEDDSVIRWNLDSSHFKPGLPGPGPMARHLVPPFGDSVIALAFSPPDGSLVAARGLTTGLAVWDVRSGERVFHSEVTSLSAASTGELLAFSSDGKRLALGTKDGKVLILDVKRGEWVDKLEDEHSSPVLALAFSSKTGLLVSGDRDGVLVLTEVATGQRMSHLKAHEHEITALAFSPDGRILASSAYKEAITLRDGSTGAPIRKLSGHPNGAVDLAFSADGKVLASVGGEDNALLLWDVYGGDEPKRRIDAGSNVWSVTFDDLGSVLATANLDHVALFEATSLRRLGKLGNETGKPVLAVAFSPNGTTIASGLGDDVVLWDMRFEAWAQQLCRRANRPLKKQELIQYGVDRPNTRLWIAITSWFPLGRAPEHSPCMN